MYNPNALSEQLKSEARRSPTVRLGAGAYGDNSAASVLSANGGWTLAGDCAIAEAKRHKMEGRQI